MKTLFLAKLKKPAQNGKSFFKSRLKDSLYELNRLRGSFTLLLSGIIMTPCAAT
jgi:hypothetical protein